MKIALVASSLACLLLALPATAQTRANQPVRCPPGIAKTFDGRCTNPGLSATAVARNVRLNQMLIHQYAYPLPLRSALQYPRGFDVNRFENSQRGSGSTNPFPLSCHPVC